MHQRAHDETSRRAGVPAAPDDGRAAVVSAPRPLGAAGVVAVSAGRAADLPYRDRTVRSAFAKTPVAGVVPVRELGLWGDEQADRARHGGPDKALCLFALEHYPHFEALLGRRLARPAFGENLTTRGLVEDAVCIGDVLRVGTALCEVSLPRNPCFKIAARHGEPSLVVEVERTGLTGLYLRVLEPGQVCAGARIELVDRRHRHATIAEANRVMHRDRRDRAAIQGLLACPELGASWRRTFERRLTGRLEDPSSRRLGPDHQRAA